MADHATHAWDLTRATGLTIEIQADAADAALATSQASVSPEFRASGLYAAEQPASEGRCPHSTDWPHSAGVHSNHTADCSQALTMRGLLQLASSTR